MKKLYSLFVAFFSLVWLTGAGWLPLALVPAGGCSQATTFLARTSGLSGLETTTYTNLICGLVTDGVFSSLDSLYWLATNTSTTGKLNLVSSSFSLTETGTGTWTVDGGYNGVSSSFLDTGFTPSTAGGNMTQNSVSLGVYQTVSAGDFAIPIGTTNGSSYLYINPTNGVGASGLNDGTFAPIGSSAIVGNWAMSRISSTSYTIDRNGTNTATPSATTNGFVNRSIFISAFNNNGAASNFTANRIIAAWFGGGLSSGQRTAIATRLNTACNALSISGC